MGSSTLGPGNKAPQVVDVLIEISQESGPVKYEVCKDTGLLRIDRIFANGDAISLSLWIYSVNAFG